MDIKGFLKKTWERVQGAMEFHGPFDPAADVKQKLEERGYTFRENATTFLGCAPAAYFDITAPDGRPVFHLLFTDDQTTNEYYRAYDAAVKECREAQKPRASSAKPGARP